MVPKLHIKRHTGLWTIWTRTYLP